MIFIWLTNVSTRNFCTSAGPAVGTVVVPTIGIASLAQAKHCRDKHVLAIFPLFFLESWEYYLKIKKSSSSVDLKHVICLFPAFERKHCKYKYTVQNP